MAEHYLIGLTAILVLGVAAQWLAWKLHLPSILLLLISGILAGPVTGFLDPDALFGELLLPVVSLSVAIILFEGGLSLSIADLREIGGIVRNLVTLGVLVTWVISTVAAYWILGLDLALSVLLGAVLVVTGPTVIIPLLRHVRPTRQIGSVVKWEGILNDPIGALLAVLVFEAILAGGFSGRAEAAAVQFATSVLTGCLAGIAGAGIMLLLLYFYWIPDFLQSPFSLSMVVIVFATSNHLQPESGLLATTVMGIALANQRIIPVKHIVEFKENLRVLIISSLFILLAARLEISDLTELGVDSFLFLAVLMFVARPAAVAVSTIGSKLKREERRFLAWMAPRGIVAAAISSIFASRLAEIGYAQAERLVPLTFFVIIATVSIYGLTAFPLARRLGIADPQPQGTLIVGSNAWTRALASVLQSEGFRVVLVDSNWTNISAARLDGFPTHFGGILSERVLDEIDLYGIGRLLALTSNDEANSLAALHFADIFGRAEVYQLPPEGAAQGSRKTVSPPHLSGRFLFGPDVTYRSLMERFASGASFKKTKLSEQFDYKAFRERYGDAAIPLFCVTEDKALIVFTVEKRVTPKRGQTLISLIPFGGEQSAGQPDSGLESGSNASKAKNA